MGRTTLVGLGMVALALLSGTARAQSLVDLTSAMGTAGTLEGTAGGSARGAKGVVQRHLPAFMPPKIDAPSTGASTKSGASRTAGSSSSSGGWKAASSGAGASARKSSWTAAGKSGKSAGATAGNGWAKAGTGSKTASAGNAWKAGGTIARR